MNIIQKFEKQRVDNDRKSFAIIVECLHHLFGLDQKEDPSLDETVWKTDEKNIRACQNRLTKYKAISADGTKAVTKSNPIASANFKFFLPILTAGVFSQKLFNSMLEKYGSTYAVRKAALSMRKVYINVSELTRAFKLGREREKNLTKTVHILFSTYIPVSKIQVQIVADTLNVPIGEVAHSRLRHFFNELKAFNMQQQRVFNSEPFQIEKAKNLIRPIGLQKIINVKKVNWEILPPGEHPFSAIVRHCEKLQERNSKLRFDLDRLKRINEFEPTEICWGLDKFDRYYVFYFNEQEVAILECAVVGNATYIIRGEWESLSRLSKAELLSNHAKTVARVIHSSQWLTKVKELLAKKF